MRQSAFKDTLTPAILISSFTNISKTKRSDILENTGYYIGKKFLDSSYNQTIDHCTFTRCCAKGSISPSSIHNFLFNCGGAVCLFVTDPNFILSITYVGFKNCSSILKGGAIYNQNGHLKCHATSFNRCNSTRGCFVFSDSKESCQNDFDGGYFQYPTFLKKDDMGGVFLGDSANVTIHGMNLTHSLGIETNDGSLVYCKHSGSEKISYGALRNISSNSFFYLLYNSKPIEISHILFNSVDAIDSMFIITDTRANIFLHNCFFMKTKGFATKIVKDANRVLIMNFCYSRNNLSDIAHEDQTGFKLAAKPKFILPTRISYFEMWGHRNSNIPPTDQFTASQTFNPTDVFKPSSTLGYLMRIDGKKWKEFKEEDVPVEKINYAPLLALLITMDR